MVSEFIAFLACAFALILALTMAFQSGGRQRTGISIRDSEPTRPVGSPPSAELSKPHGPMLYIVQKGADALPQIRGVSDGLSDWQVRMSDPKPTVIAEFSKNALDAIDEIMRLGARRSRIEAIEAALGTELFLQKKRLEGWTVMIRKGREYLYITLGATE